MWFINKIYSLDIKWGTASPIQIQDPKYGVFIPVRSNGVFGIHIEDSKKFLIKLVGTLSVLDKSSIVKFFRGVYITKVKDAISQYVIHNQVSVLEINAYIDELSSFMKERIEPTMKEYGINLVNFYVNDLSIPEDDSAVIKLKDALAKRAEMNIIGYNYQQERSFDTLEGAAKNTGSSSAPIMGAGLGLGMGVGLGGSVGNAFGSITSEINTNNGAVNKHRECPKCHTSMKKDQRFCGSCGFDTETTDENDKNSKNADVKCSNCGAKLDKNMKFCSECGDKYNPCPQCGHDMPDGATKCDKCGYEMPKGCPGCGNMVSKNVKFCPECGMSLEKNCPKCGISIEGSPKFCPECGEKLE